MSEVSGRGRRLLKFSLVGAIGIGVQLAALGILNSANVNYLLATGNAVESAVLHNFVWHQRFTWVDRASGCSETFRRLLRFHASNGTISFVGNLLLMRLFVGRVGLPVLAANVVTIGLCALANFVASDHWVFAVPGSEKPNYSFALSPASEPASALQREHR